MMIGDYGHPKMMKDESQMRCQSLGDDEGDGPPVSLLILHLQYV